MSIKTIGVIGSGIMGSGIAEAAAGHGFKVILRSRSISNAESMKATMEKSLAKQVEKEKITEDKKQQTLSNVKLTEDLNDLSDCDLIIESIVEDLDAKIELFRQLDSIAKKEAILATNTSTLPVVEMAIETSRPDHICGIHFFNPAPVMKLVEVVRPITASQETIDQALEFARTCEKEPVVVKDQAGFIVNALLFPYLNNAIRLAEQGVASYEDIDLAMKGGCGFPMGPFALLDLVGLDTSLAILDALYDEFKDPNFAAVPLLRRMVAANKLGRKTKQGFYTY
jgi:3-hydroxybutyryl-CoA dehydrogenase